MDFIQQFKAAMANDNIIMSEPIIPDGDLHRFYVDGDSANTLNGWYVLHNGELPRGAYGCWRRHPGETIKWSLKSETLMTVEEKARYFASIAAAKEKQFKAKEAAHAKAKETAKSIWSNTPPANNNHPYLSKKKVRAYGIRATRNGKLIIPLFDANKELSSLQFISGEGNKVFLKDGVIKGCYFSIGKLTETIYLAEGYATAATIYQATNCCVVIAFNCTNLLAVATLIRKKYPGKTLILAADNDKFTICNNGLNKAREAAQNLGIEITFPCFDGLNISNKPTDFNDLMSLVGIEEVKKQLVKNLSTPIQECQEIIAPSKTVCNNTQYHCIADIEAKPINWLWEGHIARGKVSIIAGNPGIGKSQLTASIAAIVTTGGLWPLDQTSCIQSKVIFLSAEDDAADTIRPRLEAAGADLSHIFIPNNRKNFDLKNDLDFLDDTLHKIGNVGLMIIDPITAYLGNTDSHKNAEVRALLAKLSDLASKHKTAVICVSHLNKSGNNDALMRVMGSLAFVAAARAAFIVIQDPTDSCRRLFLPMKNNIGNDRTGFAFNIAPYQLSNGINTSKVVWAKEAVTTTVGEVMSLQQNTEERGALEDAKEFLSIILANGEVSVVTIRTEAKNAGYSWTTICRAKKELQIMANKSGFKDGWHWTLPAKTVKNHEECHTKNMTVFDNLDYLRDKINEQIDNCKTTKNTLFIAQNPQREVLTL
jgi:putative DNA primase/helicase